MDLAEAEYPRWSNNPLRLQIDPNGDVILVIRGQYNGVDYEFVVSSRILSNASKYFKALLNSEVLEGTVVLREAQCPKFRLEGQSPGAVEIILSALHFRYEEKHELLDGPYLAEVAMHCDKYDCVRALRPWTLVWLSNSELVDREWLISNLVAAYFFRDVLKFEYFSRYVILHFDENAKWAWSEDQVGGMLPEPIRGENNPLLEFSKTVANRAEADIVNAVEAVQCELHKILQAGAVALTTGEEPQDKTVHVTTSRVCPWCNLKTSENSTTCSKCGLTNLPRLYCSPESRLAEYRDKMNNQNFWPSVDGSKNITLENTAYNLRGETTSHVCDAGHDCELNHQLREVARKADEVIKKVSGLSLSHYVSSS